MQNHQKGKKHAAAWAALRGGPISSTPPIPPPKPQHRCLICEINCGSDEQLSNHCATPKHAAGVAKKLVTLKCGRQILPQSIANLAWRCFVCDLAVSGPTPLAVSPLHESSPLSSSKCKPAETHGIFCSVMSNNLGLRQHHFREQIKPSCGLFCQMLNRDREHHVNTLHGLQECYFSILVFASCIQLLLCTVTLYLIDHNYVQYKLYMQLNKSVPARLL